jgi:hypothetical protein
MASECRGFVTTYREATEKKNLNPVCRMTDQLYAEARALACQRASARGYVRGIAILLATTVMTDEDRATRENTHQHQLHLVAVCTQQIHALLAQLTAAGEDYLAEAPDLGIDDEL